MDGDGMEEKEEKEEERSRGGGLLLVGRGVRVWVRLGGEGRLGRLLSREHHEHH